MNRRYKTLFDITILHTFFESKLCQDIFLKPTRRCATVLLNHKHFFKLKSGKHVLFYEAKDVDDTPLTRLENAKLTFIMEARNPALFNITELPQKMMSNQLYYFKNNNADEFELQLVTSYPTSFEYGFTASDETATLELVTFDDRSILEKELSSKTKRFNYSLKVPSGFRGLGKIRYKVGSLIESEEVIYVSDEVHRKKPFGVIEVDESFDYNLVKHYTLGFVARSESWKYNVRLAKDYEGYTFILTSPDDNGDLPYEKVDFIQRDSPEVPKKDTIILFESGKMVNNKFKKQEIPFYQIPFKKLQLIADNGNKQFVIDNLPNPPLGNLNAEVFIEI